MPSSFRLPRAAHRTAAKPIGRLPVASASAELALGSLASAANDHAMITTAASAIGIALSAALITVRHNEPMALMLAADSRLAGSDQHATLRLPAGPLLPCVHTSLEAGLRAVVLAQAGIDLGYTEQLYTFGEQGRVHAPGLPLSRDQETAGLQRPDDRRHMVSIGYLALLAATDEVATQAGQWVNCYAILPWEDWRAGKPEILDRVIEPLLAEWAGRPSRLLPAGGTESLVMSRNGRIDLAFGLNGAAWDEERALERHEILYDAGLLAEARRDAQLAGHHPVTPTGPGTPSGPVTPSGNGAGEPEPMRRPSLGQGVLLGTPLAYDHRRMLAIALGRLRAKIKYRPIVFELMEETFTLFELQRTVEAILGTPLHKQNFRRLVETTGLVEEVGDIRAKTGGRPAKLFRFRSDVVLERSAPGVRIKSMRA
jgi:hypothetical protein